MQARRSRFNCEPLKELIRTVPDFPKPGILFYDITTLLKDKTGFAQLIDAFAAYYIGKDIDLVLGIEARGFIFGPALAYRLNAGFVPVRKPKKLPGKTAQGELRPGVRDRFAGDPSGCDRAGAAGDHRRRPAGDRRDDAGDGAAGAAAGRRDCRAGFAIELDFSEGAGEVSRVRRVQPAAL
jgi:hypothetical protein